MNSLPAQLSRRPIDRIPHRKTDKNCGNKCGCASPPCPADFDPIPHQTRYPAANPYSQEDGEQQDGTQNREALSHFASHFRLGDFTPLILSLIFFFHHGKGEDKDQKDERNPQRQEHGWQEQPNAEQGEEQEKGDWEGVFLEEGEHGKKPLYFAICEVMAWELTASPLGLPRKLVQSFFD